MMATTPIIKHRELVQQLNKLTEHIAQHKESMRELVQRYVIEVGVRSIQPVLAKSSTTQFQVIRMRKTEGWSYIDITSKRNADVFSAFTPKEQTKILAFEAQRQTVNREMAISHSVIDGLRSFKNDRKAIKTLRERRGLTQIGPSPNIPANLAAPMRELPQITGLDQRITACRELMTKLAQLAGTVTSPHGGVSMSPVRQPGNQVVTLRWRIGDQAIQPNTVDHDIVDMVKPQDQARFLDTTELALWLNLQMALAQYVVNRQRRYHQAQERIEELRQRT